MSEFFRIHATAKHHGMTLRQLAVAVHEAEESNDDVSLIECMDELESRGPQAKSLFMDFYRSEWKTRMEHRAA